MMIIGSILAGASIIIAFEVPGTNENYQTIGYVGCLFLFILGTGIGNLNIENIGSILQSNGLIIAIILIGAIGCLTYRNKKK
jgi:hypothetical protein